MMRTCTVQVLSASSRAKSHFISAEMRLFKTAVELPFATSTLVALRQVQGAEEESVLCGGKEEAGRGCLEFSLEPEWA